MHGRRPRLFPGEGLEYFERRSTLAADASGGAQDQAGMRMTWNGLEDLACLLGGKRGILLQQPRGVAKRHIERSNRLKSAVRLAFQVIPNSFGLQFIVPYESLLGRLCQIYNMGFA